MNAQLWEIHFERAVVSKVNLASSARVLVTFLSIKSSTFLAVRSILSVIYVAVRLKYSREVGSNEQNLPTWTDPRKHVFNSFDACEHARLCYQSR